MYRVLCLFGLSRHSVVTESYCRDVKRRRFAAVGLIFERQRFSVNMQERPDVRPVLRIISKQGVYAQGYVIARKRRRECLGYFTVGRTRARIVPGINSAKEPAAIIHMQPRPPNLDLYLVELSLLRVKRIRIRHIAQ